MSASKLSMPVQAERNQNSGCAIAVVGFLFLGVVFFDGMVGSDLVRQWQTRGFLCTEGEVKVCKLHRVSKRTWLDLEYTYPVAGQTLTGKKVDKAGVDIVLVKAAKAFPVGSHPEVYFCPQNPTDAVLIRGWTWDHFLLVLFLMPFNLFVGGIFVGVIQSLPRKIPVGSRPSGVRETGGQVRVTMARWPAGVAMWLAVCVGTFLAAVVVAIFYSKCLTGPVVLTAFLAPWVFGLLVYLRKRWRIAEGLEDIVINLEARTIFIPATFGRKSGTTLPLGKDAFFYVNAKKHEQTDSKGNRSEWTMHEGIFSCRDERQQLCKEKVMEWADPQVARQYVDWLNQRIQTE